MRAPTSALVLWAYHRALLAGKTPEIDIDGVPQVGWYKMRRMSGGPFVPVKVICARTIDEEGDLSYPEEMIAKVGNDTLTADQTIRMWGTGLRHAITREDYEALLEYHQTAEGAAVLAKVDLTQKGTTTMTELGHNQPPAVDPEIIEGFEEKVRDFGDASKAWLDLGELTDADQAAKLNDLLAGARALTKDMEATRKKQKQPHIDAGKAVDAAFTTLKGALEKLALKVKPLADVWLQKEQRRLDEERRKAEEEARKQREEAERLAKLAEKRNDVIDEAKAEEAAKAAEAAEKAAQKPQRAKIASASGGTRAMSVRRTREPVMTNIALAFQHYRGEQDVIDLLTRLAARDIRASKGADITIPGFEIKEGQKV